MLKFLRYAGANLDLEMTRSYGAHLEKEGHLFYDDGEFNALQQAPFTGRVGPRNVNLKCIRFPIGEGGIDANLPCNYATRAVETKLVEVGEAAIHVFKRLAGGFDIATLCDEEECFPILFADKLLGIEVRCIPHDSRTACKSLLRYLLKDMGLSGRSDGLRRICEVSEIIHGGEAASSGYSRAGRSGLGLLYQKDLLFM